MSEAINLMDFPTQLATQLGIPTFAGQILASSIILALFMFPTLFLTRNFKIPASLSILIMGFISMSLCVALGWLPIWTFMIISLVIALLYAKQILGIIR